MVDGLERAVLGLAARRLRFIVRFSSASVSAVLVVDDIFQWPCARLQVVMVKVVVAAHSDLI